MNSNNYYWKASKLLVLATILAIFGSGLSQAIEVQKRATSKSTIEERLTKIREVLKQRDKYIASKTEQKNSLPKKPEMEKNKLLLIQWNNYWSDWSNNWSDIYDQNDSDNWNNYWSDSNNQDDWNNWSDWDNWDNVWSNWSNYH